MQEINKMYTNNFNLPALIISALFIWFYPKTFFLQHQNKAEFDDLDDSVVLILY